MQKKFRLRECEGLQCGAVDDSAPVIPRVKILGWDSKNRRRYLPESVRVEDYEGIAVNLNHPDGPNKSRVVQERFGWFENVVKEAGGAFGDLHYNPETAYAKSFAWWAKNKPSMIGMSHDAVGQGQTRDGVFVVEKVFPKSVDLVADPASTAGLFESVMDPELNDAGDGTDEKLDDLETHIKNAVGAICTDDKLSTKEKAQKIKAALKLLEDPKEEEGKDKGDEEGKDSKESLAALMKKHPGAKRLVEELDAVKTKLAMKERQELSARLIAEAKLPDYAVSETFLSQLSEAKDEKAMKRLVEDRRQVWMIQKPRSGGSGANRGQVPSQMDNKTFAERLKGR